MFNPWNFYKTVTPPSATPGVFDYSNDAGKLFTKLGFNFLFHPASEKEKLYNGRARDGIDARIIHKKPTQQRLISSRDAYVHRRYGKDAPNGNLYLAIFWNFLRFDVAWYFLHQLTNNRINIAETLFTSRCILYSCLQYILAKNVSTVESLSRKLIGAFSDNTILKDSTIFYLK